MNLDQCLDRFTDAGRNIPATWCGRTRGHNGYHAGIVGAEIVEWDGLGHFLRLGPAPPDLIG